MSHTRSTALRLITLTATAAAVAVLAGCSAQATEVTIPDALTAPGTTLAVGDTALLPGSATAKDSDTTADVDVAFTVLDITEQDGSFFDQISNPDDFAGYTAWTVRTQLNLTPSDAENYSQPTATEVFGVLSNGEYANYMSMDGFASLEDLCPGATGSTSGEYSVVCDVVLVPDTSSLDHIEWDGLANDAIAPEETDYTLAPIMWTLPAS